MTDDRNDNLTEEIAEAIPVETIEEMPATAVEDLMAAPAAEPAAEEPAAEEPAAESAAATETVADKKGNIRSGKAKRAAKNGKKKNILDNDKVGMLILKAVIMLVIPYAYLFLCGFVFDWWLKWYFMTTFIFFSLIALYVVAIVLIIIMIVRYAGKGKSDRKHREAHK